MSKWPICPRKNSVGSRRITESIPAGLLPKWLNSDCGFIPVKLNFWRAGAARDVGIRCLIQDSDFPVPIRISWNRDEEYIKKLNAGVPHNTQQRIDALSTTSKLPSIDLDVFACRAAATKNELGQNERINLACGGSSVRQGMFETESLEWVTGEWSSAHGPGAMGTSTGIGRAA
ncbi:hypothetical protein C8F04DRAFT_1244034 [Mycena alexandri]|uniref:Ig-like domain-containing protein n=1 Tax=Mycena alexandri TaxID=1745969 RepID=A0AAD6RYI1_9AGAR|nr:hypothetical protein C8F04DRAFT_1244034 [Mycena alexandri]